MSDRLRAIRGEIQAAGMAALMLAIAPPGAAQDLDASFSRDSIVIVASRAACYHFDVFLALSAEQQRRGLMHVRELPAFAGMLFVYPDAAPHSMWMKNTYIPLDILFIRADGAVSSIARHTEPLSLRSIASTEAVTYVLELNAGVTEALAIDADSRVLVPEALAQSP